MEIRPVAAHSPSLGGLGILGGSIPPRVEEAVVRGSGIILGLAILAGCSGTGPQEEIPPVGGEFLSSSEIQKTRDQRDEALRTDPDSPIPDPQRATFQKLDYYPVHDGLRFKVKMRFYPNPVPVTIITTRGKERPAVKAGYLEFWFEGKKYRLQVYRLLDEDLSPQEREALFLPFMDATTGTETYGAGRYLDLIRLSDDWFILDFNLAYHPLCAYGRTIYRCPRTPEENRLPFAVRAGEKGWAGFGGLASK